TDLARARERRARAGSPVRAYSRRSRSHLRTCAQGEASGSSPRSPPEPIEMLSLDDERGQSVRRLRLVLFAFLPEHRFAGLDWLLGAVCPTDRSRAVEDGEDLRQGRRVPKQPATWRDTKDRGL